MRILSDFMPETVARAAVQACFNSGSDSVHLDRCRYWAKAHEHDEDIIKKFSLQCLELMVTVEVKRRFARSRLTSLHDPLQPFFRSMLTYVHRNKNRLDDHYADVRNWLTIVSRASIQATSSSDVSVYVCWIEENAENAETIINLHQQYLIERGENADPTVVAFGASKSRITVDDNKQVERKEMKALTPLTVTKQTTSYEEQRVIGVLEQCFKHGFVLGISSRLENEINQFCDSMFDLYMNEDAEFQDDYYADVRNWPTILSEVSIQATSSTDVLRCMDWIELNAGDAKRIVSAHRKYASERAQRNADQANVPPGASKSSSAIDDNMQVEGKEMKVLPPLSVMKKITTEKDASTVLKAPTASTAPPTTQVEQAAGATVVPTGSDGSSKREQNDFVRVSSLKVRKKQKIGPSGGEICLQECGITFPEGALIEEKEFSVSLDNDPKKFPKHSIPITSILGCRPSMTFDKPVTVRMVTCSSAVGNAEVMASLYQRETENSDWVEKGKVVLTNTNLIQFDVMHFSDDVVGLSDEAGDQVDYHLINDVYMKKGTGTVASIFFVDQGAHDLATEDMRKRGVVPMLMKPKEIIIKMGREIKVGMAPKHPNGITATACNSPVIKITPEFLKKRGHEIYFDLENIPHGYEGFISLRYTLKIGQEEEILPISTTWPIVIPENPVLQIENAAIDQHVEVQANVVAMQGGMANVQSHGPSPP